MILHLDLRRSDLISFDLDHSFVVDFPSTNLNRALQLSLAIIYNNSDVSSSRRPDPSCSSRSSPLSSWDKRRRLPLPRHNMSCRMFIEMPWDCEEFDCLHLLVVGWPFQLEYLWSDLLICSLTFRVRHPILVFSSNSRRTHLHHLLRRSLTNRSTL